MRKIKENNYSGFTVLELVIAIAVIGILAAVLIPTFSHLVEMSKQAQFKQNIDSLYKKYITSSESLSNTNNVIIVIEDEKYVLYKDGKTDYNVYDDILDVQREIGIEQQYIVVDKNGKAHYEKTYDDLNDHIYHDEIIIFDQRASAIADYLNRDIKYSIDGYNESKLLPTDVRSSLSPIGYTLRTRFKAATKVLVSIKDSLYDDSIGGAFKQLYEDDVINQEYTLYNLCPGRVYSITFIDDERKMSEKYFIKTICDVRQIYIKDFVSDEGYGLNIRDIGGWESVYGGTLDYGKIYRCGPLKSNLSASELDMFLKSIDVETLITIRDNIYINNVYSKVIDNVLNDKPIILSCENGVYETGKVMLMIEALLGLSEDDLAKEYELSTLMAYDTLAYVNDNEYISMLEELKSYTGTSLQNKAYNWFVNNGFDETTLDNFIVKMTHCVRDKINK